MDDEIGGVSFDGVCSRWGTDHMREIYSLKVKCDLLSDAEQNPTVRHVQLVGQRSRQRMELQYSCSLVRNNIDWCYLHEERTQVLLRVLQHVLRRVRSKCVRRVQCRRA